MTRKAWQQNPKAAGNMACTVRRQWGEALLSLFALHLDQDPRICKCHPPLGWSCYLNLIQKNPHKNAQRFISKVTLQSHQVDTQDWLLQLPGRVEHHAVTREQRESERRAPMKKQSELRCRDVGTAENARLGGTFLEASSTLMTIL